MTARQLADELEVSVRTIYRDVESLHGAGVPLYGDAGHEGGYQLLDGYRTRLTGLTADEAEALFLTGLPGPAAELGLGTVVAAAQLKLQAALSPELRDRSGRIRERFLLDTPGWYHDGDDVPHLAAVADAVWNAQVLELRYRRWREPTDVTRRIEPYGVVLKAGRWYVVGRTDGHFRTYRVNQILSLEPLPERFERGADFDLATYWRTYLTEFRSSLIKGEALVRLSPNGVERIRDLMSQQVVDAVAAGTTDDDGWVRATVPIESLVHAQSEFLKLGADAEVLEPPELREKLTRTVRDLAEMYLTGPAGIREPSGEVDEA
jgi:predicted DNA-binding transcriptional regulator YafY